MDNLVDEVKRIELEKLIHQVFAIKEHEYQIWKNLYGKYDTRYSVKWVVSNDIFQVIIRNDDLLRCNDGHKFRYMGIPLDICLGNNIIKLIVEVEF